MTNFKATCISACMMTGWWPPGTRLYQVSTDISPVSTVHCHYRLWADPGEGVLAVTQWPTQALSFLKSDQESVSENVTMSAVMLTAREVTWNWLSVSTHRCSVLRPHFRADLCHLASALGFNWPPDRGWWGRDRARDTVTLRDTVWWSVTPDWLTVEVALTAALCIGLSLSLSLASQAGLADTGWHWPCLCLLTVLGPHSASAGRGWCNHYTPRSAPRHTNVKTLIKIFPLAFKVYFEHKIRLVIRKWISPLELKKTLENILWYLEKMFRFENDFR